MNDADLYAAVDEELAERERQFQTERNEFNRTLPIIAEAADLLTLLKRQHHAAVIEENFYNLGIIICPIHETAGEVLDHCPIAIISDDKNSSAKRLIADARHADVLGPIEKWRALPIRRLFTAYYSAEYIDQDKHLLGYRPLFQRQLDDADPPKPDESFEPWS